ncbi:MAG: hypothetical protein HWE10_14210 [Gammaproteobacteria bacterium]|nr:hypothetical protein [Gammaproteobacteria bacterium]
MRVLPLLLTFALSACSTINNDNSMNSAEQGFSINNLNTEQIVLVITEDESAIAGQLTTFEKKDSHWVQQSESHPIVVGRTGIAWGLGLHPPQEGYHKQEGDGKAPAGIFKLSSAFGYLEEVTTKLSYQQMSENDFCIDVNGSELYNQTVDRTVVGEDAVKGSTEPMRRDIHKNENLYKKGIFVDHNPENISGQGSCIFVHLWRSSEKPTAGCTAMPEPKIDALLAWLDERKNPVMVTLTQAQYHKLKPEWDLP